MRFFLAGVCAFALTASSVLPAAARSHNTHTDATVSTSVASQTGLSGSDGAYSGSFEIAAVAEPAGPTAISALPVSVAPTFGADFSMWNTAKPAMPFVTVAGAMPTHTTAAVPPQSAVVGATPALSRLASGLFARTRDLAGRITASAMHFVGTPYVFGGTSTYGFDCSGYVQHVFAMFGISLPRTADAQYMVGRHVAQDAMVSGDLVFFQTYTAGVSHVGIYLGNGTFIHSSSRGVQVSSLHEDYWASRYVGATHVIGANLVASHLVN